MADIYISVIMMILDINRDDAVYYIYSVYGACVHYVIQFMEMSWQSFVLISILCRSMHGSTPPCAFAGMLSYMFLPVMTIRVLTPTL